MVQRHVRFDKLNIY